MTIHKSFSSTSAKGKANRSVFTRTEKIENLEAKNLWSPEKGIFKLPKVKTLKIKKK